MKKTVLAAAVAAVALLAAPAFAKHDKAMDATMMCRPSMTKEKPMAMMGEKGMVCKSMDKMMAGGHMGPDVKGMSAAQTDAAWRAWIEQAMQVQSATGTAGGNG
jgi:hypothetical protein